MAKTTKIMWGISVSSEDRHRVVFRTFEELYVFRVGKRWLMHDKYAEGFACDLGPVLFERKKYAEAASYPDMGHRVVKLRVTIEEV